MGLDLANYQIKAKEAVRAFWGNREAAKQKQIESGKADQGERASVTAGKNMNGFLALMKDIVELNGLGPENIYLNKGVVTLPGFFRPTKLWDMLVIHKGSLIAVIELKSQVGPSFGNNFNNRAEEAIGSALDLRTAYREGAFGEKAFPFVGWLMMLEESAGSRTPVRDNSPHFKILPEFNQASYAERYNLLCRKLHQENLYSAASILLSQRSAYLTGDYSELSELTGLSTFVTTFAGHIAAEAARDQG